MKKNYKKKMKQGGYWIRILLVAILTLTSVSTYMSNSEEVTAELSEFKAATGNMVETYNYNPIDPNFSVYDTTIIPRPMIEKKVDGKHEILGVFASGLINPNAQFSARIMPDNILVSTSSILFPVSLVKELPDITRFGSNFSQAIQYNPKTDNWQSRDVFTNYKLDVKYHFNIRAEVSGEGYYISDSDSFLIYQVKQNDTLSSISSGYQVNQSVIAQDNHIIGNSLVVGSRLFIRNPIIIDVTGVSLNKATTTLAVGETERLEATVNPGNATNQEVRWESSSPSIAAVDEKGNVTAKAIGSATITVTTVDGEKEAGCQVTVSAPVNVSDVSLNKTTATLLVGGAERLTATINPSNATNKDVTWSSSNTNVATVDASGNVTARAPGTSTITVTTADGGKTATCIVTVNVPTVSVSGVSLNKTATTLQVGGTERLTATIAPNNATNTSVSWTSSDTNIATVSSNGTITARGIGTATITVRTADGGRTATCRVTVTAVPNTIKLTNPTTIATNGEHAHGARRNITGSVSSDYDLVTIRVGFKNANGNWRTGTGMQSTVRPGTKTYQLTNISNSLKWESLPTGTYRFVIEATDASGRTRELRNRSFQVATRATTLTNATTITTNGEHSHKARRAIAGKITSHYNISSIRVGFQNSNGNWRTGTGMQRTVKPGTKTYQLSKLSSNLRWENLPKGTYRFVVEVTDSRGNIRTLRNRNFQVVTTGQMKLEHSSSILNNTKHTHKSPRDIKGRITSDHNIDRVRIGFQDSNGKWVTNSNGSMSGMRKTVDLKTNTKKYYLSLISNSLKWDKLPNGKTYYFVVEVTDKKGNIRTLRNRKFQVRTTMRITDSSTIKNKGSHTQGKKRNIKGRINSDYNITSVRVGFKTINGNWVSNNTRPGMNVTIKPNTKSYNLSAISSRLKWETLLVGRTYYFVVEVKDSNGNTRQLRNQQFKVVAPPSTRVNPTEGTLTSRFGPRTFNGRSEMHNGIDIAKGGNVPIVAIADGVVKTSSRAYNGYGEMIIIEHKINGKTVSALYAHMILNSRTVKAGDKVQAGQRIGWMGSTGMSTGQHLHFEISGTAVSTNQEYMRNQIDPIANQYVTIKNGYMYR